MNLLPVVNNLTKEEILALTELVECCDSNGYPHDSLILAIRGRGVQFPLSTLKSLIDKKLARLDKPTETRPAPVIKPLKMAYDVHQLLVA
jgi:hypothetical protein